MTTPVGGLPIDTAPAGEPIDACPRCKIPHGPADPRLCADCGHVHDPSKCPRHATDDDGVKRPCRNRRRKHQKVCGSHGAKAPRALAAAEQRAEVEQVERTLARMPRPVRRPPWLWMSS